jgi:hypothetical protein
MRAPPADDIADRVTLNIIVVPALPAPVGKVTLYFSAEQATHVAGMLIREAKQIAGPM